MAVGAVTAAPVVPGAVAAAPVLPPPPVGAVVVVADNVTIVAVARARGVRSDDVAVVEVEPAVLAAAAAACLELALARGVETAMIYFGGGEVNLLVEDVVVLFCNLIERGGLEICPRSSVAVAG